MNLKGLARQVVDSSPPAAWQCQTAHKSVHSSSSSFPIALQCRVIGPLPKSRSILSQSPQICSSLSISPGRIYHTVLPSKSVHKGGNCNSTVECSPSFSLQSWFSTVWLSSFLHSWRMHSKDAILWTMMSWKTMWMKSTDTSAKTFVWLAGSVLCSGGKRVLIMKDICGRIISTLWSTCPCYMYILL